MPNLAPDSTEQMPKQSSRFRSISGDGNALRALLSQSLCDDRSVNVELNNITRHARDKSTQEKHTSKIN